MPLKTRSLPMPPEPPVAPKWSQSSPSKQNMLKRVPLCWYVARVMPSFGVCACVCACVPACVRACLRACVRVCSRSEQTDDAQATSL